MRHYALKHCQSRTLLISLPEKWKRNTREVLKRVIYVLKASTKASVVKMICHICTGISIPYIIGMAYCQLIRYSKSPKQREQKSRQLMLFPVRVYVCHTKWWQLHTQAGVKEVFSCSFCLRRLAMPE